jgi:hypothetical protein
MLAFIPKVILFISVSILSMTNIDAWWFLKPGAKELFEFIICPCSAVATCQHRGSKFWSETAPVHGACKSPTPLPCAERFEAFDGD